VPAVIDKLYTVLLPTRALCCLVRALVFIVSTLIDTFPVLPAKAATAARAALSILTDAPLAKGIAISPPLFASARMLAAGVTAVMPFALSTNVTDTAKPLSVVTLTVLFTGVELLELPLSPPPELELLPESELLPPLTGGITGVGSIVTGGVTGSVGGAGVGLVGASGSVGVVTFVSLPTFVSVAGGFCESVELGVHKLVSVHVSVQVAVQLQRSEFVHGPDAET